MTRRHGYALLSAVVALIVALSAAVYAGVAADDGTARDSLAGSRTPHAASAAPASTGTWSGAWSASPVGAEPGTASDGMAGRSVRNVVHTSTGGTSARVTLSNLYGRSPLTLTHVSIAVAAGDGGAAAAPGTMRRLTFDGATTVVIPAGGQVVSDAVRVGVPHDTDVLITTYSPTAAGPVTYHPHAQQVSYIARGDHAEDNAAARYTEQTRYWRYVTALDVLSNESDGTVVALGDSITDGITSTEGADHRWTDILSDRLRTALQGGADLPRYSVVNEGISGNQVLADGLGVPYSTATRRSSGKDTPLTVNQSALARFGRDVLSRTAVKVVVIDLGINDILRNPELADPAKITAGLRTLVRQAHAHGLKVIGATLMPCEGHQGCTTAREAVREQVNAEIRAGGVYDAVVDFDKALRDPYDPRRLRSDYDSGDHLHPSDKGYRAMADAFDLRELKGAGQAEL